MASGSRPLSLEGSAGFPVRPSGHPKRPKEKPRRPWLRTRNLMDPASYDHVTSSGEYRISTYSKELHEHCKAQLVERGYLLVASYSRVESFSTDGLIVAGAIRAATAGSSSSRMR